MIKRQKSCQGNISRTAKQIGIILMKAFAEEILKTLKKEGIRILPRYLLGVSKNKSVFV